MSDVGFFEVARLGDLAATGFVTRTVGEANVVICQYEGDVYALENLCPHEFVCFDNGDLEGERLICPRHRAAFDVRTGEPFGRPAFGPLQTYRVKIAGDRVLVEIE